MQIKEKAGYRTGPGDLSCTLLLMRYSSPVPHFCTKEPHEPFKEPSISSHFEAGQVSKTGVQDRSQKRGTGQGCASKCGLQDRSLGERMDAYGRHMRTIQPRRDPRLSSCLEGNAYDQVFYICIYVYMYICIYVYMYICIYVYMYICLLICISFYSRRKLQTSLGQATLQCSHRSARSCAMMPPVSLLPQVFPGCLNVLLPDMCICNILLLVLNGLHVPQHQSHSGT